jgi:peptidoglycan hydrolase-like protein with peptidoglycan-binding domain
MLNGFGQVNMEELAHYSHRSHRSHYSHRSHSSHYSSAGGGSVNPTPTTPLRADLMDIQVAQRKLNDLGFNSGAADGVKGEQTISAIKAFQSSYGLDADGVIGAQTKQMIESVSLMDVQKQLKELGYAVDVNGSRDEKTIQAFMQFQSDYALNPDAVVTLAAKQKLDGVKIIDVQRKLKSLGYNCEPTGYRDGRTTQAIKGFQLKSGLEPSGIVTEKTKAALGL